jgi:hypothetical protein
VPRPLSEATPGFRGCCRGISEDVPSTVVPGTPTPLLLTRQTLGPLAPHSLARSVSLAPTGEGVICQTTKKLVPYQARTQSINRLVRPCNNPATLYRMTRCPLGLLVGRRPPGYSYHRPQVAPAIRPPGESLLFRRERRCPFVTPPGSRVSRSRLSRATWVVSVQPERSVAPGWINPGRVYLGQRERLSPWFI